MRLGGLWVRRSMILSPAARSHLLGRAQRSCLIMLALPGGGASGMYCGLNQQHPS